MPDDDKIIRFPGAKRPEPPRETEKPDLSALPPEQRAMAEQLLGGMSADQLKAMQLIGSGLPFVLVAIKPTDNGADFFTALHGDHGDLRNAFDHLPAVIERLFQRKGVLK
jgi:hypothetical protein